MDIAIKLGNLAHELDRAENRVFWTASQVDIAQQVLAKALTEQTKAQEGKAAILAQIAELVKSAG